MLNQLHSDTIACVLYELLVCRSLGFGIVFRDFPSRLRFHKFQYCSIFKVLLALLSDSSIIISKVVLFVKHFFDIFLSFPNAFLKASARTLSGSPLRFCWYIAFIWLLKSCCLARQLIYNTTLLIIVNTFFKISFKFFQTSFLVLPNIHASPRRAAVRTPSQKQMSPLPPIASPVQNAANAASSLPQLLQPVRSTIYSKSSA